MEYKQRKKRGHHQGYITNMRMDTTEQLVNGQIVAATDAIVEEQDHMTDTLQ